jgi:hypothetical protein
VPAFCRYAAAGRPPDSPPPTTITSTAEGSAGGGARPGHQDFLPSSVTTSKITVAAGREVISAWS